jgi:hypothetical protein
MHTHETHACEMHAYKMHTHETHACEMHAYKMHACEIHTYEMHMHKIFDNIKHRLYHFDGIADVLICAEHC